MMEMDYQTIQKYFDLILTISHNGYFLNINRYYKDTTVPYRINRYPYDKKWKMAFSKHHGNKIMPTLCLL